MYEIGFNPSKGLVNQPFRVKGPGSSAYRYNG